MTVGKWINDLSAAMPLADAARLVLKMRLDVVREYLGRALRESEKEPEYVHQLRVGTRRAGAALDIFALCLPEAVYPKARKYLRRLRRAAGAARDWDVFLGELVQAGEHPPARHRPGVDFLTGYALGQRVAAQLALEKAEPDYPFTFERFVAETLPAVQQPDVGINTLIDLARPVLGNLLQELDQAVARDLDEYANLHQVRIVGKRLRYAMEVFADCFAPAFRDVVYPAVEQMQEVLGRANDSHVASQRLRALADRLKLTLPREWKRYKAGLESLLRRHERRLPEERERFLEWWRQWQKSGGEAAFTALLKPASADQATFRNTSDVLEPPKPRELETTTRTD